MCETETADSPIATLERWELHGGAWRTTLLTGAGAAVELRTCAGEPTDQLRSSDPALLAYLARRPDSESDPAGVAGHLGPAPQPTGGEQTGIASFPASDPPACWTWETEGRRT